MKKGQRYLITSGDYSDYDITDYFVALKDFSFDAELDAWLVKHPDEFGSSRAFGYGPDNNEHAFLKSLRDRGLVADEVLNEVHISDYGTAEKSPANDRGDAT